MFVSVFWWVSVWQFPCLGVFWFLEFDFVYFLCLFGNLVLVWFGRFVVLVFGVFDLVRGVRLIFGWFC